MIKLEEIREKIRAANKAYWQDAKPIISDLEYDSLMRALKALSPNDPLLEVIGSEQRLGQEVKHQLPMLSLDKAYSYKEILDWATKVARSPDEKFLISCKYDGMSVELYGTILSTRGDGIVGHDITSLAPHITLTSSVEWNAEAEMFEDNTYGLMPLLDHTEEDDTSRTVGELLIPLKRFNELKQEYPEVFKDYKTPRNLAAGFVNSKPGSQIYDLKTKSGRPVTIAEIVSHKAYELEMTLQQLIDEDRDVMKELRDFHGYPSDGICFFLKDKAYFDSLGATHHHPRGAIAWKFTDEQAQTIVRKIEWQVGEQHVTPVCVFDTVPLDGVLIQKATAHCAQWLKERNICVGSRITIERRGGVIPKVINVENDDPNAKAVLIDTCPECGTKLREEGKFLSCPNEQCEGKCVNRIVRGLEAFGLKGIGPALASKVVHELMIDDIIEWCEQVGSRSEPVISLLRAKGFTDNEISIITRVSDVMDSGVTPEMLLQSVCIPKCGPEFIMTVERKCGGIQHLLGFAECDAMYGEIVDKCKLDAVTNFMIWMERNKERFLAYMDMFKILPGAHAETGLNGSKGVVCFTGSGPQPRDVLSSYARGRGYQVTDNANKCTILVAENPNGNSTKLQKARAKGIEIIDYERFSHL